MMNKKLKKLIRECNGHWEQGDDNMPNTVSLTESDMTKLFESIVKECANIAYDADTDHGDKILEHFNLPYIEE